MQDLELMQRLESSGDLDHDAPDLFLREFCIVLCMEDNLLIEVALICKLHDDAA